MKRRKKIYADGKFCFTPTTNNVVHDQIVLNSINNSKRC